MSQKEKGLFDAFVAGKLSRRELLAASAKLGISAAAGGMLLTQAQSRAMAADFDWMAYKGTKLKLLLNKHPYADAMIANLQAFKDMTGMDVTYDVFPEDVYFDKVTAALSSSSSEYDAFMTGAYMTWTYGPAGWIADLNEYIKDPAKTNPGYNWDDVLPGLRASTAWNGVAGGELGSADAKQWCIPWGYELNNISYNTKMFEKAGVQPPKNLDELVTTAAKLTKDLGGPYGIGVRGSRSWATIHPGFLSGYSNFGQRDFTVADGKWWPSTMKLAANASTASCSQMTFGCRGIIAAHPLPRCVDSDAPAATASAICPGLAFVCPIATRTPRATRCSTSRSAPSTSGASVTSRMRPSAASWRRSKSSMLAAVTNPPGCAPRNPSSGEMYGPSMWMPAIAGSPTRVTTRAHVAKF